MESRQACKNILQAVEDDNDAWSFLDVVHKRWE